MNIFKSLSLLASLFLIAAANARNCPLEKSVNGIFGGIGVEYTKLSADYSNNTEVPGGGGGILATNKKAQPSIQSAAWTGFLGYRHLLKNAWFLDGRVSITNYNNQKIKDCYSLVDVNAQNSVSTQYTITRRTGYEGAISAAYLVSERVYAGFGVEVDYGIFRYLENDTPTQSLGNPVVTIPGAAKTKGTWGIGPELILGCRLTNHVTLEGKCSSIYFSTFKVSGRSIQPQNQAFQLALTWTF